MRNFAGHVFISYVREDLRRVERLQQVLEAAGISVWRDTADLWPGEDWRSKIRQAITHDALVFLACFSRRSIARPLSYQNEEMLLAVDQLRLQQPGNPWLIPVRLDACEMPDLELGGGRTLASIQRVDFFGANQNREAERLVITVLSLLGQNSPAATADLGLTPASSDARRALLNSPRFATASPRVWNVPVRNPHFTGRAAELHTLEETLAAGVAVTVHSVRGMGGVGKTNLVTEYAHVRASDYDVVWWIAAEEAISIPDQFAALAVELGMEPAIEPKFLQAQVHAGLCRRPGWLLIFDNAESVQNIWPWLPSGPPQVGVPGHVLVTTRRSGFSALGQVVDLDVIELPSAVTMLRSHVPDLDRGIGECIAEELGRLPLAVEQAAAYLGRSQMPAQQYLNLLRARATDLYARGRVVSRDDTIATLWDISLERVTGENAAAMQLLEICAYLAPEPIPIDLFTAHGDLLPEPLASTVLDELAFSEAIAVLTDHSLAKRISDGLQLHRLIQAAARAWHGRLVERSAASAMPPQRLGEVRSGDSALATGYPLATALQLLHVDAPAEIVDAPADWPRWATLLQHVLAATGHVDGAGKRSSHSARIEATWLLDRAGIYLRTRARFADARPLLERATAITEAIYGPNDPKVGVLLNDLSSVLYAQGFWAEAKLLVERALVIAEAAYGRVHHAVATCLNNMSQILLSQGHIAEARSMEERALAISVAVYGPAHPTIAVRLDSLAMILRTLKKSAQAKPLMERALAISQAVYGESHPVVAVHMNDLAVILLDLSRPTEAHDLIERALAIDEHVYGAEHPYVGVRLNNLAQVLETLGRSDEALPLQQRSLAIRETFYGPDHPELLDYLANLARTLLLLGRPAQAIPLLERALRIEETANGPDHPAVARHLKDLGQTLYAERRFVHAKALLERALEIDECAYGPEHPAVAIDLINLAEALGKLKRPTEAKPLLERALTIAEATDPPDYRQITINLNNLAHMLREVGQNADARPLQERALAIAEMAYGPDHRMVSICLINLSIILQESGQSVEAETLRERAKAIAMRSAGPADDAAEDSHGDDEVLVNEGD